MTEEAIKEEARAAILSGNSTPVRTYNPRAREHVVQLKNRKTIHVIYDRTIGDVVKLISLFSQVIELAEIEDCLYAGNHTRSPKNPIAFRKWASGMRETHVQTMCPGCNQWVVWKPKERQHGSSES